MPEVAAIRVQQRDQAALFAEPGETPTYLTTKDNIQSIDDSLSEVGLYLSRLQRERLEYTPLIPDILTGPHEIEEQEFRKCSGDHDTIARLFPNLCARELRLLRLVPRDGRNMTKGDLLRIGVVLSGGQAPGGHNVITGVYDYLEARHPGSTLVGFKDGPKGVIKNNFKPLTARELRFFRNQGGFHLICSGRDKIEKPDQLAAAKQTCLDNNLDGLVVIGGDDSNTNAALLAEYFLKEGIKTRVIGVPKTIDGDLKCPDVPISFGFDTASKTYSGLIGNIMTDAASAKKYYHFIRLMGRAASHVTLECALQTRPQLALISEEVQANKWSLHTIASKIADMITARAAIGKNYGVVLIPEGLIEFVYDVRSLIAELNELLAAGNGEVDPHDHTAVEACLSDSSRAVCSSLSPAFKAMLLEERDPHGNVQVSHIETEKLLIKLVQNELEKRANESTTNNNGNPTTIHAPVRFSAIPHFFGYEGRCALPTNFDSCYCYALGAAAASLVGSRRTGYMATVSDLQRPAAEWRVGGTPLASLMCLERRQGADKPVVKKALVDLEGPAFRAFASAREAWALGDCYRGPGPVQYAGSQYADVATMTLGLEINGGQPVMLVNHALDGGY